jgi:hypothetical protein
MATISRTRKYTELNYRLKKLNQLYAVMSELRLHTNMAVDKDAAKYYNNRLYLYGDYGSFLTASLESMMQVFFIELDGFIGSYWDEKNQAIKKRQNESGSLGRYLYDSTRSTRKKTAQVTFESLLKDKAKELLMIHEIRGILSHFTQLKERNQSFVPSDVDMREILDRLADVIYLLGYQRLNKPDYIEINNSYIQSTQHVIDKLVAGEPHADDIRWSYLKARSKWFSNLMRSES